MSNPQRILGGLALAAVLGMGIWVVSGWYQTCCTEFTECYGVFDSRAEANRAAKRMREAGFEASVDKPPGEPSVQFESGETGDDAREFRQAFRNALRTERGELGHPGGGCLERTPLN